MMVGRMRFSCVIPTIGRQSLKTVALPSVAYQKRPFDEILVIFDDTSWPDHIDGFSNINPIGTGVKKGGPYAQSLAFDKAKTDYVVFLDDDDLLSPDYLDKLETYIQGAQIPPCFVATRIRKVWTEGRLPERDAPPPFSADLYERDPYFNIAKSAWKPSTCSGLVISKRHFSKLPLIPELRGFNDVQLWKSAKSHPSAPSNYCADAVCIFYQYFSQSRKTSSFEDRITNLSHARAAGVDFSQSEQDDIIFGALLSEFRSNSYKFGIFKGMNFLISKINKVNISGKRAIKLFIHFFVSIWLSFQGMKKREIN